VVVDNDENQLTKLVYDLRSMHKLRMPVNFKVYPVNYGDHLFFSLLQHEGPFDAIANFAGMNHIQDESDFFAIRALLENNIINMQFLFDRLLDSKIENFFAVAAGSGDEPETFMGISNRISEEIILAYSHIIPLTSAKYHTVAFSGGSMLCGYLNRIINKLPITAPSNISKSFISPEEAGQLSLLACYAGSSGDIFFPKNLENNLVPYSQIANSFLSELGFTPVEYSTIEEAKEAASKLDDKSKFYPVHYFNTRTFMDDSSEILFSKDDIIDWNSFSEMGVIKSSSKRELHELILLIERLSLEFNNYTMSKNAITNIIKKFHPEFVHAEIRQSLDRKLF
jgi:hypothetical protein